ncbi:hypothetical protein [Agromyces larvae]|uniref:Uncharacterized protein n=1 Tax=Agromyces larvae TaxID=2929802 RepID=A0ABY4BUH0_9MICO|nr:hypothetical protein [Agromyces larvae]UOE42863.1 hypothetical protein MTO99_11760 [Agromyces larvae]
MIDLSRASTMPAIRAEFGQGLPADFARVLLGVILASFTFILIAFELAVAGYSVLAGGFPDGLGALAAVAEGMSEFGKAAASHSLEYTTTMLGLVVALHAGAAVGAKRSTSPEDVSDQRRLLAALAFFAASAVVVWMAVVMLSGAADTDAPVVAASILVSVVIVVLAAWVGRFFVPALAMQISVAELDVERIELRRKRIGSPSTTPASTIAAWIVLLLWVVVPAFVTTGGILSTWVTEGYARSIVVQAFMPLSVLVTLLLFAAWIALIETRAAPQRWIRVFGRALGVAPIALILLTVISYMGGSPQHPAASTSTISWYLVWAAAIALGFAIRPRSRTGVRRWSARGALDLVLFYRLSRNLARAEQRLELLREEAAARSAVLAVSNPPNPEADRFRARALSYLAVGATASALIGLVVRHARR